MIRSLGSSGDNLILVVYAMRVSLLYGRDGLEIELPPGADAAVVRKPTMPIMTDPSQAIRQALSPLPQLARHAKSACIAICDITRPVPNHLFLRPMVEAIHSAGVPLESITILVATGLHRPNLGDELAELIGDKWVLSNVNIVNHDARADAEHVDLGTTSTRGTEVKIDRRFVEADLKVVTGLVEPHFMAGFSGGRKVIAPGLAHADTITTFHSFRFMNDPAAINCNLQGNPLHEEQLEIAEMVGDVHALNTVIDEDRRLAMVNFGPVVDSHQEAVDFVQRFARVPMDRRFWTVITSAAGYPLDKTYYQTVKGMVGATGILEPGGNLIIVSQCEEGLGSPEYVGAQRQLIAAGADGFLQTIERKRYAEIDEWQTQMQTKAMAAGKIYLYSSLSEEQRSLTGVVPVDDLNALIARCIQSSEDASVAVIPEGPYVIPFCTEP